MRLTYDGCWHSSFVRSDQNRAEDVCSFVHKMFSLNAGLDIGNYKTISAQIIKYTYKEITQVVCFCNFYTHYVMIIFSSYNCTFHAWCFFFLYRNVIELNFVFKIKNIIRYSIVLSVICFCKIFIKCCFCSSLTEEWCINVCSFSGRRMQQTSK